MGFVKIARHLSEITIRKFKGKKRVSYLQALELQGMPGAHSGQGKGRERAQVLGCSSAATGVKEGGLGFLEFTVYWSI